MKKLFKTNLLFIILVNLGLLSFSVLADEKIPAKPVETVFNSFIDQGKVVYVINYKNFPHWHTYWKNPGDAGLPTKIETDTPNLEVKEFNWPVPTRYIEEGDILAYGYSDQYSRFFTLEGKTPKELKIKST